jgi:RimJ/RimL family protein N-acetyltransferase
VQATVIGLGVGSAAAAPGPLAEVAWIVGTPWQGRGFAREAAVALVAWLAEQGVADVVAHIHPGHAASAAVAAAAGLAPTGVIRDDGEMRWHRTFTAPDGTADDSRR